MSALALATIMCGLIVAILVYSAGGDDDDNDTWFI